MFPSSFCFGSQPWLSLNVSRTCLSGLLVDTSGMGRPGEAYAGAEPDSG